MALHRPLNLDRAAREFAEMFRRVYATHPAWRNPLTRPRYIDELDEQIARLLEVRRETANVHPLQGRLF